MNSASPDPQPSTQLFQGITNNSLRGQRHASKRPRKPKPTNIMERICLSFGPALRALSKERGDTTCVRDPCDGPGWLLYFPNDHFCEVMVCDDPCLQIEIVGFWIDWANWDMALLPPLVIPLDENSKHNYAFELPLLVSYTYGRLLAISKQMRNSLDDPNGS